MEGFMNAELQQQLQKAYKKSDEHMIGMVNDDEKKLNFD
jgi:hypothetical protein